MDDEERRIVIFKPEMVEKILAGGKTETRRPVKLGETECRYKLGRTYAVQPGRTKHGIARITVLEVRRELPYEISESSAINEGFAVDWVAGVYVRPVEHFFGYWERLYGGLPDADEEVWVIRFELEEGGDSVSSGSLRYCAPSRFAPFGCLGEVRGFAPPPRGGFALVVGARFLGVPLTYGFVWAVLTTIPDTTQAGLRRPRGGGRHDQ